MKTSSVGLVFLLLANDGRGQEFGRALSKSSKYMKVRSKEASGAKKATKGPYDDRYPNFAKYGGKSMKTSKEMSMTFGGHGDSEEHSTPYLLMHPKAHKNIIGGDRTDDESGTAHNMSLENFPAKSKSGKATPTVIEKGQESLAPKSADFSFKYVKVSSKSYKSDPSSKTLVKKGEEKTKSTALDSKKAKGEEKTKSTALDSNKTKGEEKTKSTALDSKKAKGEEKTKSTTLHSKKTKSDGSNTFAATVTIPIVRSVTLPVDDSQTSEAKTGETSGGAWVNVSFGAMVAFSLVVGAVNF